MEKRAAATDEKDLVRRAVQGDAEAFGDLYMLHLDRIYRYIFYKVGNEREAEDLTEQVFLNAWEAIGGYRHKGHPFYSWLYRIAHNVVIDYYRTGKEEEPLDDVSFTLTDESLKPEELMTQEAEVVRLCEAIAQLPEKRQELILLRFVEGLSHAQVAQILGKSEGSCRVMQHRALTALSEILGER
jgi:RNA polymerase sigma-70 factor (ECF subfamily)